MKHKFLIAAAGILLVSVGTALAKTDPITPAQDEALRNYAASLVVEPPQVAITATLKPPTTTYTVDFAKSANSPSPQRQLQDTLTAIGMPGVSTYWAPHNLVWTADIGCGSWAADTAAWSHPDGAPPTGCPHEHGTSHPGTISVKGVYNLELYYRDSEDVRVAGSEPPPLMKGEWSFVCTYSGSESGTGHCEEKLEKWEGRFGNTVNGPQRQLPSPKAIAAVVAAVAAAYAFRRPIARFVRPILMRDPK